MARILTVAFVLLVMLPVSVLNGYLFGLQFVHLFSIGWRVLLLLLCPVTAWLWCAALFAGSVGSGIVGLAFIFMPSIVTKDVRGFLMAPIIAFVLLYFIGPYFYPVTPADHGFAIRFFPFFGGRGY